MHPGPPGEHFSSHADLLQPARTGTVPLDGIVIPAAREPGNLRAAFRLAADLDVPVVVLCSRYARPDAVADLADRLGGTRCTAVDLREPVDPDLLPRLETSEFGEAMIGSHGDLSLKRNLGLLLGRMTGWRTLLFLDDDIRGVAPPLVRRAAGTLRHHVAVGMPATAYPDNSVVCHARRLGGEAQGVFVSGSALAVDLGRVGSFFPEVYNEDWLFLAPMLEERQVARVGSVRQTRYDPFGEPLRAGGEEFGDVLAEGLIGRLHTGSARSAETPAYWTEFLRRRAGFIAAAAEGCARSPHPDAPKAVRALMIAERARARLSADVMADYVSCWRRDLRRWRAYLSDIVPGGDLLAALRDLGLPGSSVGPVQARRTTTLPSQRRAE